MFGIPENERYWNKRNISWYMPNSLKKHTFIDSRWLVNSKKDTFKENNTRHITNKLLNSNMKFWKHLEENNILLTGGQQAPRPEDKYL